MACEFRLEARLDWQGNQPNATVRNQLFEADLLVLPSRFDGWGVVVNEALTAGTRVLASDACRASDLLGAHWRRRVFKAGDVGALTTNVGQMLDEGRVDGHARRRISRWAEEAISPMAAAAYLRAVLGHVINGNDRPAPPWWQPPVRQPVGIARNATNSPAP